MGPSILANQSSEVKRGQSGPKRVGVTAYTTKKSTNPPININISKQAIENVKNAQPDPKPLEIKDISEKQKNKYDLPELQFALEEILKEIEKYKVKPKTLQNEAVYWSTLISQSIPNWALVDKLEGIFEPLKLCTEKTK